MLFGVTIKYLQDSGQLRGCVRVLMNSLEDVVPTKRKAESRVDKACCVTWKPFLVGEVCCHFAERDHDHITDGTNEAVTQEDTKGPAAHKRSSRPDDKPSANSTSQLRFTYRLVKHTTEPEDDIPQSWRFAAQTSLCEDSASPPGQPTARGRSSHPCRCRLRRNPMSASRCQTWVLSASSFSAQVRVGGHKQGLVQFGRLVAGERSTRRGAQRSEKSYGGILYAGRRTYDK